MLYWRGENTTAELKCIFGEMRDDISPNLKMISSAATVNIWKFFLFFLQIITYTHTHTHKRITLISKYISKAYELNRKRTFCNWIESPKNICSSQWNSSTVELWQFTNKYNWYKNIYLFIDWFIYIHEIHTLKKTRTNKPKQWR